MLSSIGQFYRFCVQSKYEGTRTYEDVLDILEKVPKSISAASLYPFPYPVVTFCAKYFPGFSSYTLYLLKKIKHNPDNCGWSLKSDFDTCFYQTDNMCFWR